MKIEGLFLLLLLGLVYGRKECTIFDGHAGVICSGIKDNFFLPDLGAKNDRVRFITIYNCVIPTLPNSMFSNFSQVTNIVLDNIQLKNIEKDAFKGLVRIRSLTIKNNPLKELHPDVFSPVSSLEVLRIMNNYIEEIDENLFAELNNLDTLNLMKNNISRLEGDLFKAQEALQSVDLSENPLKEFRVTTLPNGLLELNLKLCQLTEKIPSFTLENITMIDLDHNKIEHLKEPFFQGAKNLKSLFLRNNSISRINDKYFSGLWSLTELQLGHNQIAKIDVIFGDLTDLMKLGLNNNRISRISHGAFENLTRLEVLDLSHNQLRSLQLYLLLPSVRLKDLNFSHNKISSFDADGFFRHLQNLINVTVDYNPWNCKDLIHIQKVFKSSSVNVKYAKNYDNVDNVYGLACESNELGAKAEALKKMIERSKIGNFFNDGFKKSTFFEFFDSEFNTTTFFKNLYSYQLQQQEVLR